MIQKTDEIQFKIKEPYNFKVLSEYGNGGSAGCGPVFRYIAENVN